MESRKGIAIVFGGIAAVVVFVVAVVIATGAGGREPGKPGAKAKPHRWIPFGDGGERVPPSAERGRSSVAYQGTEAERIARAMDISNIRGYVTSLQLAAATDDTTTLYAMLGALKRYRKLPAPILEEALASATSEKVRLALNQALTHAQ